MHLDICSNCHPFFTGRQKLLDTEGRVERFTKKFGAQTVEQRKTAAKAAKAAKAPRPRPPRNPASRGELRLPRSRLEGGHQAASCRTAILRSMRRRRYSACSRRRAPVALGQHVEHERTGGLQVARAMLVMDRERLARLAAKARRAPGRSSSSCQAAAASAMRPRAAPQQRQPPQRVGVHVGLASDARRQRRRLRGNRPRRCPRTPARSYSRPRPRHSRGCVVAAGPLFDQA